MHAAKHRFVVFLLDDQRYALFLSAVERVVRAVEITALPNGPEIVSGVFNLGGVIVPVIDVRKRFRLTPKKVEISDQFIIAITPSRRVALISDAVIGVMEREAEEVFSAEKIVPGIKYVDGILGLKDGMILIHDLNKFLSVDEERMLDEAMA